jgi:hypothetical protein
MFRLLILLTTILFSALRVVLRSRSDLFFENIALRQQVEALKRSRRRPQLDDADRAFWLAMRSTWRGWAARLMLVQPDTVVRWHRDRFRRYWSKLSRQNPGPGRPRVDREVRDLIRRMTLENDWGAPRIHGELVKLGFTVSEATVSRYMPRRPANPEVAQRWLAFLRNHVEGIAAMDFFTLPTASLSVLYCWFVIHHQHRRALHFNATFNPSAAWVIQQLREAFPYETAPRYLIFDRDSIFSRAVVAFVKSMGTKPRRTAYRSPWQNPMAERWIGGCRRELFDHVIVFNELHAVRLARSYIAYFHEDRTHLGLNKDTPRGRPVTPRPSSVAKVVALPRAGGLHHRYEWCEAA